MTRSQQPTAYWVTRECDDNHFALVPVKAIAEQRREYYEQDHNEPFQIQPEYRTAIPYCELPETWIEDGDWTDRVPYSVRVTDVPEYAQPTNPE